VTELERIYSSGYFKAGESDDHADYTDYLQEETSLKRNFSQRIGVLRRFRSSGTLLEVGCAYGFFLDLAKEIWDVRGIDISADAAHFARTRRGLDVIQSDFERLDLEAGSLDVIAMWDTIEHLYDPVISVRKSASALKPGGVLALTTGDIGTLIPQVRRRRWRLLQPNHLSYFSRQSIARLLADCGLSVVHFSHDPTYRSLREMAKALIWRGSPAPWQQRLYDWITDQPWSQRQVAINLYDILFVIARKGP
jgi:SAM-dependent methyltransferase